MFPVEMCHVQCYPLAMSNVDARTLHNKTSAVLDEVERGVSFWVECGRRTIARLGGNHVGSLAGANAGPR